LTTDVLNSWASWAANLNVGAIPDRVLQRARLQHLSTAGALHTTLAAGQSLGLGLGRGKVPVVGSKRKVGAAQALRYHAGNAAAWDYNDQLLWGSASAGVCATWGEAAEANLGELLAATVAANELAGRVGAAGLLNPHSATSWTAPQALGSAVAIAKLRGLDASDTADAMALALSQGGVASGLASSPVVRARVAGSAAVSGLDAVNAAGEGIAGPRALLDDDRFFQALGCPVVLRNVFDQVGSAWLSEALWFKLTPGNPWHNVAFQALETIHDRHMRAADKRLRPDQWTHAEIRVPWPVWAAEAEVGREQLTWSLRTAYAVHSFTHQLSAEELGEAFWAERGHEVAELASKIQVVHAWEHTIDALVGLLDHSGGLLGGLSISQLKHALGAFRTALPDPGPPVGAELLELGKLHRFAGGVPAASFDAAAFRYVLPMDVKVHTTRGGFWPETRSLPEGSPGWDWEDTLSRVQAKFGAGDPERAERGAQLLLQDLDSGASGFVTALG